ncbi:hypothetical protein [Algivirga pacifica]|uniref:Co-chaperone DjlA N-terminal domain-containing protein n=1 Tax=Algivirga pacifica TaxID=1162670 RepID=A0ABP9DEJ9_9BACT
MALTELYNAYKTETATPLTEEQFEKLLLYFPCLLIVASDGVVDDEEWYYVNYLARFIAQREIGMEDIEEMEKYKAIYLKEMQYLCNHLGNWKESFLMKLKEYLDLHLHLKDDLEDIMVDFAEASDGISEEESKMMDYLKETLNVSL